MHEESLIPDEKKGELVRIAVLGLAAGFLWPKGSSDAAFFKAILVFVSVFAIFRRPTDQKLRDVWAKGWNSTAFVIFISVLPILLNEKGAFVANRDINSLSDKYLGLRGSDKVIPNSIETPIPAGIPTVNAELTVEELSKLVRWEDSSIYKKYKSRIQRLKHEPSQLEKLLVAKSVLSEDQPDMLTTLSDVKLVEYVETGR